jgi:hypothetical protein
MDQEVESVGREELADTATVAVAESELAVENGAECDRKGKGKRGKHKCPFPSCSAKVVHLPRHMRQVHKWEKEDSVGVVNAFRLRKDKKGAEKSKLKHKVCSVDGCSAVVKRIHNHLIDFHGMERGSKEYRRSLKLAFHHQVIEISSESTCESSSTDEEELRSYKEMRKADKRKETKKKFKEVKKVKHESIFKKVYSSDDEDESDNEYHPLYPSIFRGICAEREREYSDELLNAEESLKGDGLAERDESPPRGESSESPGRKELPGREELPRRKEVPGKKELPGRKELSGRKELPGRKVVPDRDEVMSEEWSSEEQESIDQSSSDGSYTDDSEVESIHLSLPLNTSRDEQHIFEQFEKWLPTADGGRKDERNAQQCCRQIKLVTQYIRPEKPTLKDVLDRQTLRDQWLNKLRRRNVLAQ